METKAKATRKQKISIVLAPMLCPLPWFSGAAKTTNGQLRRLISQLYGEQITARYGHGCRIAAGVLWPFTAPLRAFQLTLREGKHNLGIHRISRWRQFWQQIVLAFRYNVSPHNYYPYRYFDFPGRADALFNSNEVGLLLFRLNRSLDWSVVDDKRCFYQHCKTQQLPTPEIIAFFSEGKVEWITPDRQLPQQNLFSKPINGMAGAGTERWRYRAVNKDWKGSNNKPANEGALLDQLCKQSLKTPLLLQPCLENHPEIEALAGTTLATVRAVTGHSPKRQPKLLYAELRMSTGENWVDNIAAGGISALIDPISGQLSTAYAGDHRQPPYPNNPKTGCEIAGYTLPDWDKLVALCIQAHQTLTQYPFIGWDIALTPTGPTLVEGNTLWGAPAPMLLGETEFAAWVLENLDSTAPQESGSFA